MLCVLRVPESHPSADGWSGMKFAGLKFDRVLLLERNEWTHMQFASQTFPCGLGVCTDWCHVCSSSAKDFAIALGVSAIGSTLYSMTCIS
jgi:hypothetical protein